MSLAGSYTFVGAGNWSLDAISGSQTGGGIVSAVIPTGATVEKAFLYASEYGGSADPTATLSLGSRSNVISAFTALGTASNASLTAFRADVTSIVQADIGSTRGSFDFTISNIVSGNVDGYALVVVYSLPTEATRTIALLDGASASGGDSFTVTFPTPIDTTVPGFEAQMSLGIGFGYQGTGQYSTVSVNGRLLTSSAGGQDDGQAANGALITIGGLGDSTANPADPGARPNGDPRFDDELYNLAAGNAADSAPFLPNGATSIVVNTLNPSNDDNIFFAAFNIVGKAAVNSNQNDAPVAVNDGGTGFRTTESTAFKTASVLGNDFDPDNDKLTVVSFDTTGTIGQVTLNSDGTFNYNPNGKFAALNTGDTATDHFTYTISDGTLTSTATVFISVSGEGSTTPPPSGNGGFFQLSNGDDVQSYANATSRVLVQGLGGNDIIGGSRFDDSLNGGAGDDKLSGYAGNDVLTGGTGADRMSGGAGNDTFVFNVGDLNNSKSNADFIIDFQGAGQGTSAPGDQDFLLFFGFGAGTTLVFDSYAGSNQKMQYYRLVDPTDASHSGLILVQMADTTDKLVAGSDYSFLT